MNIYRFAFAMGYRYVRASTPERAACRAFKVWGIRAFAEPIGPVTPDIGAYGYNKASATVETFSNIRGTHKPSSDALRGFYSPSKATKQRIHNKAALLLVELGLV